MAKAPEHKTQEGAANHSIRSMADAGLLSGVGMAAMIANVRGLARAVDRDPGSAPLWREYRQAVKDLREEALRHLRFDSDPAETVDPLEQLMAELDGEAEG